MGFTVTGWASLVVSMSDILKAQLWQVQVRSPTTGSRGYSIVTKLDAPMSFVEEMAHKISTELGRNRQVTSVTRTATVFTRRVLHE